MFSWITGLFGSANKLIDQLPNSTAKMELQNKMMEIQGQIHNQVTELMKAEASSNHWLVANWRPATSVILVGILFCDAFEWVHANEKIYSLAELFLGVYAGSRGLEKITSSFRR